MQQLHTTFEGLVNNLTAKGISETTHTEQDMLGWSDAQTFANQALTTSFTSEIPELQGAALGQQVQVLTDLVLEAKMICSSKYKSLQQEYPDAKRERLNQDEGLLVLNAVRRKLRRERNALANKSLKNRPFAL